MRRERYALLREVVAALERGDRTIGETDMARKAITDDMNVELIQLQPGDTISGYFLRAGVQETPRAKHHDFQTVYYFLSPDIGKIGVWGGAKHLDHLMQKAVRGAMTWVTLTEETREIGNGREPMKLYKVDLDTDDTIAVD